jgi:hypothetical protein
MSASRPALLSRKLPAKSIEAIDGLSGSEHESFPLQNLQFGSAAALWQPLALRRKRTNLIKFGVACASECQRCNEAHAELATLSQPWFDYRHLESSMSLEIAAPLSAAE